MDDELFNLPPLKTLWQHLRQGIRRAHSNRPLSFYLLLTVPVVLLLGVQLARAHENPRKFFILLAILFTFFMVLVWRALVDCILIARKQIMEEKEIFRSTLGEPEFLAALKKKTKEEKK